MAEQYTMDQATKESYIILFLILLSPYKDEQDERIKIIKINISRKFIFIENKIIFFSFDD